MLKLYKNVSGLLHYHEAWFDAGSVTEHWGPIGTQGESREHALADGQSPEKAIHAVLSSAISEGFRPIEMEDHATLLVEYSVSGMGTEDDLAKRHALEEHLDGTLGWTGLGFCDGGSIGSGTMEVCCVVVDFAIAKDVIERDLANTEYSNFSRIYDESDA
jgi:hypothetical protein